MTNPEQTLFLILDEAPDCSVETWLQLALAIGRPADLIGPGVTMEIPDAIESARERIKLEFDPWSYMRKSLIKES